MTDRIKWPSREDWAAQIRTPYIDLAPASAALLPTTRRRLDRRAGNRHAETLERPTVQATLPMPMTLPSARRARSRSAAKSRHSWPQAAHARARRGVKISRLHARDCSELYGLLPCAVAPKTHCTPIEVHRPSSDGGSLGKQYLPNCGAPLIRTSSSQTAARSGP